MLCPLKGLVSCFCDYTDLVCCVTEKDMKIKPQKIINNHTEEFKCHMVMIMHDFF